MSSHGGHITCYSEIGSGTTFRIYLPAIASTDLPDEEPSATVEQFTGEETILVVDDEDAIRDFASEVLNEFGYNAITASSGEEALEIIGNGDTAISLVILGYWNAGEWAVLNVLRKLKILTHLKKL